MVSSFMNYRMMYIFAGGMVLLSNASETTHLKHSSPYFSFRRVRVKSKIVIRVCLALLVVLSGCQSTAIEEKNSDFSKRIKATGQYGRGSISDGLDTNSEHAATRYLTQDAKSIIIYFSRSGNTENLVFMVQSITKSDVIELEVVNPYSSNYEETVARANEERDSFNFPKLKSTIPSLSQYDRVYLGTPIWAMTLSNPMISFLETHGEQLSGKEIVLFSTNAGYGEGSAVEKIRELVDDTTILESFQIQDEAVMSSENQVKEWLDSLAE